MTGHLSIDNTLIGCRMDWNAWMLQPCAVKLPSKKTQTGVSRRSDDDQVGMNCAILSLQSFTIRRSAPCVVNFVLLARAGFPNPGLLQDGHLTQWYKGTPKAAEGALLTDPFGEIDVLQLSFSWSFFLQINDSRMYRASTGFSWELGARSCLALLV